MTKWKTEVVCERKCVICGSKKDLNVTSASYGNNIKSIFEYRCGKCLQQDQEELERELEELEYRGL